MGIILTYPTLFLLGLQNLKLTLTHFSFLGSPAYDSVRPLSYQEADVFLLCYKISDPISLYNVKNKWIRELRKHRPDVPVILCGCQVKHYISKKQFVMYYV